MDYKSFSFNPNLQTFSKHQLLQTDVPMLTSALMSSYLSKQTIHPLWNRISQSPLFSRYKNISKANDLFSSDFPAYLLYLFNEFGKNHNNSHYFSSCFSKYSNENQLNAICEAAAFLTTANIKFPSILLSENFILPLISISTTNKGFSALMSLQALSNIIENSEESASILFKFNIFENLKKIYETNNSELSWMAAYTISSLAKYDFGDFFVQTIFHFFIEHSNKSSQIFDISLRAFVFLSVHHPHYLYQQNIVDLLYNLIRKDTSVINHQCFSILCQLIINFPDVIQHLHQLGIFSKILMIFSSTPANYCIEFLCITLKLTRDFDSIIFNNDFLDIFSKFYQNEKNLFKNSMTRLFIIALSSSNVEIISNILNSQLVLDLFDTIAQNEKNIADLLILAFDRAFSMVDNDDFSPVISEFADCLNEIDPISSPELYSIAQNILTTKFSQT
ncbi:hypothetical protein TRFO_37980 [Tritrichomonas foetus]|uniref:Uncharacterized protein n=1 Tax=Tritrichomonas foetus TaxID=1144522 RepID=A0A1J4JE14_9EUKA|nr:hypothetical protein TRFO_37980 [Tritrichomonas foetus]|eukprot:OHS95907.1 hypothetical protein TRFO_37980 [Tritrichomonas foetus]